MLHQRKHLQTQLILLSLLTLLFFPVPFALGAEVLSEGEPTGLAALYGDEEFVSIATGSSKPVYKAPAVASVITAQQIRAMGAKNLNEILETVPGLHVGISAFNRLDSIYSIRGIHTGFNPQVLFLMNGIPFNIAATGSHPILFRLPVAAISRIEVIRGPGSAIYGADAFSGVINIITKTAEDSATEMGGRIGSFASRDLWLTHGQDLGNWKLAVSLEWQTSNGDKNRTISSDYQSILDAALGTSASLAPGPLNTGYNVVDTHIDLSQGNFRLRFWNWHLDDTDVGAGGALALDPAGRQNEDLSLVDMNYDFKNLATNWEASVNLNHLYYKSDSYLVLNPPGTVIPVESGGSTVLVPFPEGIIGNPSGNGYQAGIDLSAVFSGINKHRLRFGSGIRHQKQNTSETKNYGPGVTPGTMTDVSNSEYVYMPDASRKIYYLSLQDEWQIAPDWDITSGIRYDHYSDFGATVNPRLALVWATRYNLTSKLLYGRAFRAPSFQEQLADQNPVALGNPNLDPEVIDTLELAFDYRPTFTLQTILSLFGYRAQDLIEYLPSGGDTKTAQNARDQDGYGFEFELNWDITETIRITGNYAWQHAEDRQTGDRVADAPVHQAYLNIHWKFHPQWAADSQFYWIADRYRASGDPRAQVADYFLVNVNLRRSQLFSHWDFSVVVHNLFDEEAYEPSDGEKIIDDYPLEGRSLWCELSYRF